MGPGFKILVALSGLLLAGLVLRFLKRGQLSEAQALPWLFGSGMVALSPLAIATLDRLSRWIGVDYPPAFYFFIVLVMVTALLMVHSVQISRLTARQTELAQLVAILRHEAAARDSGRDPAARSPEVPDQAR
jgi:uncharacterized membrane-anchored protein